MKICKIQPDYNICCGCIDDQVKLGLIYDCKMCAYAYDKWYQLLGFGKTIFGKRYAKIIMGDRIDKVPLNRIFDIKEVKAPWEEQNKEDLKEETGLKEGKEKS